LLIVDDERSIRLTLKAFLSDAGHDVDEAADAEEAQAKLRAKPFDVVVSDIVLPKVSGVELLRAIRAASPNVQVVMMTGEFDLIKAHPEVGARILADVDVSWPLSEIVLQHHERMDGSGYPRKLPGASILEEARLLAVADVVEAMASHRPYRPSLGVEKALSEIESKRGQLYDPAAADVCLRLFREHEFAFEPPSN